MKRQKKPPKPAPVTPPQQDRSRDTMDKLLDAARELLEEKSFEDVTVRAVVDRAKSSTGAFYARFENRDALLDVLDDACAEELRTALTAFLDRCDDESAEMIRRLDPGRLLAEQVGELTELLISFHRRNRGPLRAVALRPRERRKEARKREAGAGSVPPTEEAMPRLLESFGRFREIVRHPDPERAPAVAAR